MGFHVVECYFVIMHMWLTAAKKARVLWNIQQKKVKNTSIKMLKDVGMRVRSIYYVCSKTGDDGMHAILCLNCIH